MWNIQVEYNTKDYVKQICEYFVVILHKIFTIEKTQNMLQFVSQNLYQIFTIF